MNLGMDVVDLVSALIGTPSESRQEAAIADAVEAGLRGLPHLEVVRDGNTLVARTESTGQDRVLIAGHLDTVPSSGNDQPIRVMAGGTAPDGSTAPEERIYGLGACDMKGGLAVALKLAHDLRSPNRDLTFVFYECEEIDSIHNGLRRLVENRPALLQADFAILMEPSDAGVEAGCQGTIRIAVHTQGRRAHTARAWMGENAIHATAEVLARITAFQPRRPLIDGLQYHEGLQAVAISGGVAGNVVPDVATVIVNHRFAPDRSADQAEGMLRELFDGFEVEVLDRAEGALPGLSRPAAAAFVAATGATPRPKYGWTDVARFTALGVPAVNFGPADPSLAHTPYEFVPVEQLRRTEAQLRAWLSA